MGSEDDGTVAQAQVAGEPQAQGEVAYNFLRTLTAE